MDRLEKWAALADSLIALEELPPDGPYTPELEHVVSHFSMLYDIGGVASKYGYDIGPLGEFLRGEEEPYHGQACPTCGCRGLNGE